jgi:hypothetical protein
MAIPVGMLSSQSIDSIFAELGRDLVISSAQTQVARLHLAVQDTFEQPRQQLD